MKYKIETLTGEGFSQLPPAFINTVFPTFNGQMLETQGGQLVVTFQSETQVNPVAGLIIQKFNPTSQTWETI
jgi:hypothetical protein